MRVEERPEDEEMALEGVGSGEGGRGEAGGGEVRVSVEEVERIEALAHLRLDEEVRERIAGEMESILSYVRTMAEVDVEGVEPWVPSEEGESLFRDPELAGDPLHRAPADFAPAWEEGFFVVPRIAALDATGDAKGEETR